MSDFPDPSEFLSQENIGVLATASLRGRPHASPVWYAYEDDVITISTTADTQKVRDIRSNPHVTLVVDRRSVPYYAVIVRGVAKLGPRIAPDVLLRLAIRHYGGDVGREYAASERAAAENEVTIQIRPSRIIESKAETGRMAS